MPNEETRDPERVRGMFGRIARRYDLLNHLLSANLDRRWRRAVARELAPTSSTDVLDLCGGTGDLSTAVAQAGAGRVVCCDFARPMLEVAARKFGRTRGGERCVLVEGDALRLPFAEDSFDAVTCGFGVRNLVDLSAGLREMRRVLRPGGRLLVLEFSQPTAPILSGAYRFYLRRVLPHVGDGVSGASGPYGYLARTIAGFPEPAVLAGRIREAGFDACEWSRLSGGIVAIHVGHRAGARGRPAA